MPRNLYKSFAAKFIAFINELYEVETRPNLFKHLLMNLPIKERNSPLIFLEECQKNPPILYLGARLLNIR